MNLGLVMLGMVIIAYFAGVFTGVLAMSSRLDELEEKE